MKEGDIIKLSREELKIIEGFMNYPDGFLSEIIRWNDVMPVVNKINQLDCVYHWELTSDTFEIHSDDTFINTGIGVDKVCKTIISFINWYNKQK
jgi:hypothetical protein